MTDESALAIVMLCTIAPVVIAWACHAYTKRHRVNRRVRRGRRWPTEGQTHRSYWSGARRFSQE